MNRCFWFIRPSSLFAFASLSIALIGQLGAQHLVKHEKPQPRGGASSAYEPNRYQILNINNLWTWATYDGQTKGFGTYFPRGTTWTTYVYGFIFGSKAFVDSNKTQPAPYGQHIRVGGSNYSSGLRQGWVIGRGANAVPLDPSLDPRARIYRIRRDWRTAFRDFNGNFTEELRRDAAESYEIKITEVNQQHMQAVFDRYEKDWKEWLPGRGAPFIDRNKNGKYDAPPPFSDTFTHEDLIPGNYDEPGIALGNVNRPADQVIWTVCNDLHRITSVGRFGSEPTGLEIQITLWGYQSDAALGSVFFRRVRFINKGGVEVVYSGARGAFWLDSMYVGQWVDPDLGDNRDDLVGCDTTLDLGYVYNANAIDLEYQKFNMPPPAAGFSLLQGPVIPASNNTGYFDLSLRPGYENLHMTSFTFTNFSSTSRYTDPNGGYYTNALFWYKMLRGFAPLEGPDQRFAHPPEVEAGPFPLAGDPITGAGHIDGLGTDYSYAPGDRRFMISSGPFNMAPQDTQEIVVAYVAGLGADRLSSIASMKTIAQQLQASYPDIEDFSTGVAQREATPSPPEHFSLLQNHPNPFAGVTRIAFSVRQAGETQLAIYDMLGRELRRIVAGRVEPGLHHAVWDGHDQHGRALPSGIYFCRLFVGGEVKARKLVLVR